MTQLQRLCGSLIIFVVESIVILIATVYLHHKYNFEAELTIAIYASALSGYAYKGYLYSMKPLIQNVYYKFSRNPTDALIEFNKGTFPLIQQKNLFNMPKTHLLT